ncbi:MAG: DUF885 domain-containing protein [Planctomycetota bacterium]
MRNTRIRMTARLGCVLLAGTSVGGAWAQAGDKSLPQPAVSGQAAHAIEQDAALHKLFDDYWQFRLRRHPEWATNLGDHRYDFLLFDYGDEARKKAIKTRRAFRTRVAEMPRGSLSPEDQLGLTLFEWRIDAELERAKFPGHLMPITQMSGPHITLGTLQTTQPLDTPQDCVSYTARLRGFSRQVHASICMMNLGLKRGVIEPKVVIEKSLPQIEALIADNAKDSPLFAPAKTLGPSAGGLESQNLILDGTRDAIDALRLLHTYLKDHYLPKCRDTVGYGDLPDGPAWYRQLIRYHTTIDLRPEQIHQMGLDELKRIRTEMQTVAAKVGFEGTLRDFIEKVRADPELRNKSADEIMRRHAAILERTRAKLPELFGVLPKTPIEVFEMEPIRAMSGPAGYYYAAPADGSRPAYFVVNTSLPTTRPIYTMEALTYHEALPGHHLQGAIVSERTDLPMFRRHESINVFIEGWALYAEGLGGDLGGYKDPYAEFGRLTYDAWRAARLVVDTGIHHFGWTREKSIAFLKENTALSEENIAAEVDRYIAWPAQALAYKIGEMHIQELRRTAEQALGDRFDVKAFHDHLLSEGSLPISLLERRMAKWVEGRTVTP